MRNFESTKGNCERVDVEVIIEDENSDELTERAARFNGRHAAPFRSVPFRSHCELETKPVNIFRLYYKTNDVIVISSSEN